MREINTRYAEAHVKIIIHRKAGTMNFHPVLYNIHAFLPSVPHPFSFTSYLPNITNNTMGDSKKKNYNDSDRSW